MYLAVLTGSMIAGAILGAVLAFIAMIAASGAGHLDLSMLFILGFNTIFIKIASVSMDGYKFGYIRSVLAPALAWYLFAMLLGKQHVFAGWHMHNAIASVVLVTILYGCVVFVGRRVPCLRPDAVRV